MTATTLPPGVTDVAREAPRARVRGVSEALPPGERILWEGAPDARALGRHLFFLRPLSAYLGAMVAWWIVVNRSQIATQQFWATLGIQLMLVGGVVGGAWLLSRAIANGTTYAITDRRIVMRFGVIFPLTINVPLHYVDGAKARQFADGTGQIAVQLNKNESIAWIVLFPHVRPFQYRNPEPLLRALTDPVKVGEVLRAAVLAVPAKDAA
jgi:hypothetical protein